MIIVQNTSCTGIYFASLPHQWCSAQWHPLRLTGRAWGAGLCDLQVTGKDFHKYYFDLAAKKTAAGAASAIMPAISTMCNPIVRMCPEGAMAVVSYTRAVQSTVGEAPKTTFSHETRVRALFLPHGLPSSNICTCAFDSHLKHTLDGTQVWQKQEGGWKNVHMHRSGLSESWP